MVDNLGNELTPEQSAFFKNSKVRDSQGNLLVCYHGTKSQNIIEGFDKNRIGLGCTLGDGFYFSSEEGLAKEIGGPNIYKVYLNLTNPKLYICTDNTWNKFILDVLKEYGVNTLRSGLRLNPYVTELLKEDGYDGVIAKRPNGAIEYVVYESNQVKLVTNQNPTGSENINK